MGKGLVTLSVDVGGSNVKGMRLDAKGKALSERIKIPTPRPARPSAIVATIATIAAQSGGFDRVSVGFPGVIRSGCVLTAVNLDGKWTNFDLQSAVANTLRRPTRV